MRVKCCISFLPFRLLLLIWELSVLPFGPHQSTPSWGQPLPIVQRNRKYSAAHQPALPTIQSRQLIWFASKTFLSERSILSRQVPVQMLSFHLWSHSVLMPLTSLKILTCKKIQVLVHLLCPNWLQPLSATSCRATVSDGGTSRLLLSLPTISFNPSIAQVTCK